jgi:acyl-CoA thioesterase YciA
MTMTPSGSVELRELVRPANANHRGTLFAGQGLQLLAEAAFLAGRNFAQKEVVMASVTGVEFLAPVAVGHQLTLRAWVSRVGRCSMTVCTTGIADAPGAPADEVLKGVFEMVAVDTAGRPTSIDRPYLDKETTA